MMDFLVKIATISVKKQVDGKMQDCQEPAFNHCLKPISQTKRCGFITFHPALYDLLNQSPPHIQRNVITYSISVATSYACSTSTLGDLEYGRLPFASIRNGSIESKFGT